MIIFSTLYGIKRARAFQPGKLEGDDKMKDDLIAS